MAAGDQPDAAPRETEAPSADEPRQRLRQNSASVVAIPEQGGRASTRLTPMQVTFVFFASWATLAAIDVFGQPAEKLAQVIVSVLVVLLLSAVHELGHVFAGSTVGLRLVSCSVGPLSLVRYGRRFALDENRYWIRFAGCVEHDIPRGTATRTHLTVSAIGGPLANFALAAVLFSLRDYGRLTLSIALWSAVFGLINAIPLRLNGQTSDGGLVWRLWSRRPADVAWRDELLGQRSTR